MFSNFSVFSMLSKSVKPKLPVHKIHYMFKNKLIIKCAETVIRMPENWFQMPLWPFPQQR
jgi:hypothetical protein